MKISPIAVLIVVVAAVTATVAGSSADASTIAAEEDLGHVTQNTNLRASSTFRHLQGPSAKNDDEKETIEATFGILETQYADHSTHPAEWVIIDSSSQVLLLDNIPPDFAVENGKGLEKQSGRAKIKVSGRRADGDHFVLSHGKKPEILPGNAANAPGHSNSNGRRRLATVGVRTVLVLRGLYSDGPYSQHLTEESFASDVFGIGAADAVNLKSQYDACSNGQLIFQPAMGTGVTNGVLTVDFTNDATKTVSGRSYGVIGNEMVAAAEAILGGTMDQFDHVMRCIPPGTTSGTGWVANAVPGHWVSTYNDHWCGKVSAQLHEIGHNLLLGHSGEGTNTYGDQSSVMGYSYYEDDGPRMCFNAPKSYQLGWFGGGGTGVNAYNRIIEMDASTSPTHSGLLYGMCDHPTAPPSGKMIIRVADAATGKDYYVSFKRKAGANSGTVEGGNQVLVHSRSTGTGYASSMLEAKLSAGGSYPFAGLTLSVTSIGSEANIVIAGAPTEPPTKDPTMSPTVSKAPVTSPPTDAPTQNPTASPTGTTVTKYICAKDSDQNACDDTSLSTCDAQMAANGGKCGSQGRSCKAITCGPPVPTSPTSPPVASPTPPPAPTAPASCTSFSKGECDATLGCKVTGKGKHATCVSTTTATTFCSGPDGHCTAHDDCCGSEGCCKGDGRCSDSATVE